ncbi:hypothetical protein [Streptomyces sp. NPDC018352]|uniref:hypothetical protein n=1 Tax=Streptomyces sp. NPDC018352 TaxID=3157194 RepID=UPI0033DDCB02
MVFTADEKPQIQALERTVPVPPMVPGTPEPVAAPAVGTMPALADAAAAFGRFLEILHP